MSILTDRDLWVSSADELKLGQLGVSYQTVWRYRKAGKLPHPATQTDTGTAIAHYQPATIDPKGRPSNVAAIYARVFLASQKAELDSQAERW